MRSADTAQPRKHSNVTRPFPILWVGSGDETIWHVDLECISSWIVLALFPGPSERGEGGEREGGGREGKERGKGERRGERQGRVIESLDTCVHRQ